MKMRNYLILLVSLVFISYSYAQSPWTWIHPKPVGTSLFGSDFIDENTGFVVGQKGLILKVLNGGEEFQTLISRTAKQLNAVEFASSTNGVAVGRNIILRTTNGGVSWDSAPLPSGVTELYAVSNPPANSNIYYAVGSDGRIIKSINAGRSWSRLSSPVDAILLGVSFPVSESVGYACGGSGQIIKTVDAGLTWNSLPTGVTIVFNGIFFLNDTHGYACGQYGQVWITRNGVSGSLVNVGTIQTLRAIRFVNHNLGLVVGDNGFIAKTTNGGTTWHSISSSVSDNLLAISLYGNRGYIFGDNGAILKSTDGGASWEVVTARMTDKDFYGITSPQSGLIFVFGKDAFGLKSTDGGNNWREIQIAWTLDVNDCFFLDAYNGFICGKVGLVASSSDGGENWTIPATFPDSFDKYALRGAGSTVLAVGRNGTIARFRGGSWTRLTPPTTNHLYGVFMRDDNLAWICGTNGYVAKTTNGGTSWVSQSTGVTEVLYGIYFVDDNLGFTCGEGGRILKTVNGGTSWVPVSSGVSASLSEIGFASAHHGWAIGSSGLIIRTTDGGTTWFSEIVYAANELADIAVLVGDTLNAVVCGSKGAILKRVFTVGLAETKRTENNRLSTFLKPNPSRGRFSISSLPKSTIKIYDAQGKLIQTLEPKRDHILKNIKPGIYFLIFDNEKIKLIIN